MKDNHWAAQHERGNPLALWLTTQIVRQFGLLGGR